MKNIIDTEQRIIRNDRSFILVEKVEKGMVLDFGKVEVLEDGYVDLESKGAIRIESQDELNKFISILINSCTA